MDKIGAYTNTADGSDEFTEGDPGTSTPATEVDGGWLNAVQRELLEVMTQMGLTPSDADDTLLWQALQKVYGKTHAGNPQGNVAADVLRERCWDTSQSPPALYIATAADGTIGGTTWAPPRGNFKDGDSAFKFQDLSGVAALFLDGVDGDFSGGDYTSIKDNAGSLIIQKEQGSIGLIADDGTIVGSPTGGAQGAGSVNVESLFVNGLAVGNLNGGLEPSVDVTNGGANDLSEIDFTGITSGATRITISFHKVSTSGSEDIWVQLGDSGGVETSGYASSSARITASGNTLSAPTGAFVVRKPSAGDEFTGHMVLTRESGNRWIQSHLGRGGSATEVSAGGGDKTLSVELDRIRVTVSGTNTFDNGNISIVVE